MIKPNSRIIRAGLSQGLPSLLTFVSALWLLWQTSLAEFGLYSLLFAITRLIIAVQAPLITMPMNVLAKQRFSIDHYADFFNFHTVALGAGLVSSLLIATLFFPDDLQARSAFMLFVLAQLTREFIKSYFFSTHNVESALKLESYTAAVFLLALIIGHFTFPASLKTVLFAGAIAGLVPALYWALSHHYLNQHRRRRFKWKRYLFVWKISKWSLAGAISNEIVARSYNYLVALFGGYELLGIINFSRQLFAPLQLLSNSWMQIGIPLMREHYSNSNVSGILGLRKSSQLVLAACSAAWTATIWLALPWISAIVPDGDLSLMGQLTILWGFYYLVEFQLIIYRIEIQVLLWFRWLFLTELVIAALTIVFTPLVLKLGEPSQLIALGFLLNLFLWTVYYRRFTKKHNALHHAPNI
jgi:O-antigen/teichoic acid export membrane protein